MRKLAKKTSKMMSKFEPPKKCQFYLDGLIKEDSHFWLSKLLLKKRKFEIELEFVIFSKKLLSGKNSTFFTSNKNSSILGKNSSSHSSFLVPTRTTCQTDYMWGWEAMQLSFKKPTFDSKNFFFARSQKIFYSSYDHVSYI